MTIPEKQARLRRQLDEGLQRLRYISPSAEAIAIEMLRTVVDDLQSVNTYQSARLHHWREYIKTKSQNEI